MVTLKYKNSIGWLVIILIITLLPVSVSTGRELLFGHMDKIIHFILFMVFSFLLSADLLKNNKLFLYNIPDWIIVFVLAVLIGSFTEVVQHLFIPGRSGSIPDLISDIAGSIAGIAVFKIVRFK